MKHLGPPDNSLIIEALSHLAQMWTWLYKYPAHDKKYYISHVANLEQPWKNDCPICDLVDGNCAQCILQWEGQKGTFCTDPESPFRKWKETSLDNPDYRAFYAGEIIALAQGLKAKLTGDASTGSICIPAGPRRIFLGSKAKKTKRR